MSNSEYNRERNRLKMNQRPLNGSSAKKLGLGEKKFMMTAAILSVLVLISVYNRNTFSHNDGMTELASSSTSENTRQIASVPLGTSSAEDSTTKEWAMKPLDEQAKLGQNPSRVEQFTFGLLEGKYSVRLKDGKLNSLELTDSNSQPKKVSNLEQFLAENKEILPVSFESISAVQASKGDDKVQKFALLSLGSRRMAEVEFRLDEAGRLLSMRINKSL